MTFLIRFLPFRIGVKTSAHSFLNLTPPGLRHLRGVHLLIESIGFTDQYSDSQDKDEEDGDIDPY